MVPIPPHALVTGPQIHGHARHADRAGDGEFGVFGVWGVCFDPAGVFWGRYAHVGGDGFNLGDERGGVDVCGSLGVWDVAGLFARAGAGGAVHDAGSEAEAAEAVGGMGDGVVGAGGVGVADLGVGVLGRGECGVAGAEVPGGDGYAGEGDFG